FKNAKSIHFLNEEEKAKSINFSLPSFISGNGTSIEGFKTSLQSKNDSINLTFIGRYDINHKGLDLLLESVCLIKKQLIEKNVRVDLYGSDYKNNKNILIKKAQDLNINNILSVNGPILGKDKIVKLINTDLFLATSRFEGLPQSVIEAMSYGVPCILTPGTNMQRISTKYQAGWNVEQNANSIAQGILESLNNKTELKYRGIN